MRKVNFLKWAVYTVCVVLLCVFQTQAGFYPPILGTTPLFIIPTALAVAMFEGETAGGVFGILAGLIWDCETGRVFGFNALFFMIYCIAVALLVKFLFRRTLLSILLFTAFFTLFHEFITWFFFYYMAGDRDFTFSFMRIMLPTTVITVIFAVPLYYGARQISRKLTKADSSEITQ